jgi:hypothetical protein
MSWVLMILAASFGFDRYSWRFPAGVAFLLGVPYAVWHSWMISSWTGLTVAAIAYGLGQAIFVTALIFACYSAGWWLSRFRAKFRPPGGSN